MKTKAKIKEFFYRSFAPHGKEEYAEIFTRGLTDKQDTNTVYPWFYLRVAAVLTAVYTVYALIISMLPGGGDRETFYFVGGAFLDVAFLVLAFELYPRKDFSLLTLLCVCLIGGTFAEVINAFIYYFHSLDVILNGWKLAAIAGVGEEIAKAIPAIVCILILKKKDTPFAGFLIGAAIGTWFSLTENASYIHNAYFIADSVLTATARAFGAPFSHAMWTALISWAFCKFRKPYINIKFYGVVILCMALHFCIDMPLWDYIAVLFAEAAVCGLIAFIFGITVIYRERKLAFRGEQLSLIPPATLTETHVLNITLTSYGVVLCALLLLLAAIYSPTGFKITEYSVEQFTEFAHDGYTVQPDYERELDGEAEINYLEQRKLGELVYIEQMVTEGEVNYLYCYRIKEGEQPPEEDTEEITDGVAYDAADGTDEITEEVVAEFELVTVQVMIEIDGEESWFNPHLFDYGGDGVTAYLINPEFSFHEFKFEDGKIMRYTEISVPDWKTITVLCTTGAVALSGAVTYFLLKRKFRNSSLRGAKQRSNPEDKVT